MNPFKEKINIEFETNTLRDIIDGTLFYKGIIKKNMTFIIFCTFLLIFYISNRYKCENQLAQIEKLEKDITDLRYINITTSAELMSLSRQSEILRIINKRGIKLNESIKAPQRIYVKK